LLITDKASKSTRVLSRFTLVLMSSTTATGYKSRIEEARQQVSAALPDRQRVPEDAISIYSDEKGKAKDSDAQINVVDSKLQAMGSLA